MRHDNQQLLPLYFQGVTSRVLTLPANVFALQQVCDTYLNHVSDEVHFEPLAPFVFLTIITYNRMANAVAAGSQYGWTGQHEVYFYIPLACMQRGHAPRIATSSPFIFVDNPWSIEIGREIYGWPKQPASFQSQAPHWAVGDPTSVQPLLTVQVDTFADPFTNQASTQVPLISIDRAPPFSIGRGLWQMPLEVINPVRGLQALWRQALQVGPWPLPGSTYLLNANLGMLSIYELMRLWCGGVSGEIITANLKQVGSLVAPGRADYQSVTLAPMQITNVTKAGIDSAFLVMAGDPTGGYRVKILNHELFPIVQTLGLTVASVEQQGANQVSTLAPIYPFWMQCDFRYGENAEELVGSSIKPGHHPPPIRFTPGWDSKGFPTPPFDYPALSARTFWLDVSPTLMQNIIDSWDMPCTLGTLTLNGSRVVMAVASAGKPAPMLGSAGWLWNNLLAICVPVTWERCWDRKRFAVWVNPLSFIDSPLANIATDSMSAEVLTATFLAPPDIWLASIDPHADQDVFRLSTLVLPALNVGAQVGQEPLIKIIKPGHKRRLHDDEMPMPSIKTPRHLPVFSFRSVPSARDPSQWVYKEWFAQNFTAHLEEASHTRQPVDVTISRYPSLDLVKLFALRHDGQVGQNVTFSSHYVGRIASVTLQSIQSLAVQRGHGQPWEVPKGWDTRNWWPDIPDLESPTNETDGER